MLRERHDLGVSAKGQLVLREDNKTAVDFVVGEGPGFETLANFTARDSQHVFIVIVVCLILTRTGCVSLFPVLLCSLELS